MMDFILLTPGTSKMRFQASPGRYPLILKWRQLSYSVRRMPCYLRLPLFLRRDIRPHIFSKKKQQALYNSRRTSSLNSEIAASPKSFPQENMGKFRDSCHFQILPARENGQRLYLPLFLRKDNESLFFS
jgi:hypothetical protein